MNERGSIIKFPSSPPAIIPGEIIESIPLNSLEPQVTKVIFAEDDDTIQFGQTLEKYAQAPMILSDIPDATKDTGGFAMDTPLMNVPERLPATLRLEGNLIKDQSGIAVALVEQGIVKIMIISNLSQVNPLTGERFNLPNQPASNVIPLPQSPTVEQPPAVVTTNPVATEDNLRTFIKPLTELPKAA